MGFSREKRAVEGLEKPTRGQQPGGGSKNWKDNQRPTIASRSDQVQRPHAQRGQSQRRRFPRDGRQRPKPRRPGRIGEALPPGKWLGQQEPQHPGWDKEG